MRIFRQRNRASFIKALSDDAQGFSRGFARVEKVMKLPGVASYTCGLGSTSM